MQWFLLSAMLNFRSDVLASLTIVCLQMDQELWAIADNDTFDPVPITNASLNATAAVSAVLAISAQSSFLDSDYKQPTSKTQEGRRPYYSSSPFPHISSYFPGLPSPPSFFSDSIPISKSALWLPAMRISLTYEKTSFRSHSFPSCPLAVPGALLHVSLFTVVVPGLRLPTMLDHDKLFLHLPLPYIPPHPLLPLFVFFLILAVTVPGLVCSRGRSDHEHRRKCRQQFGDGRVDTFP